MSVDESSGAFGADDPLSGASDAPHVQYRRSPSASRARTVTVSVPSARTVSSTACRRRAEPDIRVAFVGVIEALRAAAVEQPRTKRARREPGQELA